MRGIRERLGLKNPLCLAIDLSERDQGIALLRDLGPLVGMVKCGPVPFLSWGKDFLVTAESLRIPVFLDLKWHDIPNTVFETLLRLPSPAIRMVTIHAQGGTAMISAARKSLDSLGPEPPALIAVTLLTHLTEAEVKEMGYPSREEGVVRLGSVALSSGADGLVMSPGELSRARMLWGESPFFVTPGIRPKGPTSAWDDQFNARSPQEALTEGSDLLVVGRPIIAGPNPREATLSLLAELA
ncbi:MAG: orotidine-5'-phosphate decarboxylase [Leptospirillia bacterium]